ncbi:MAG TPA: hypothetical protein VE196_12895, partial [Pseudonocardiaceae bacterium]|nr:hypothetical protein [Pseudonocardiaceae bacterium]
MTNTTTDVPTPPTDNRGRVIHGSCLVHRVARGLTNLVVSQREGEIGLDPHAAGARKVTLD